MAYPIDIVIPVWNRPVETRACLSALVEGSPQARIIMVNYGSERETERILEEFAEALDDRAMLVSTERNVGRVAALNHGISLTSAPLVAIVQDEITVGQDWLAPLEEIMASHPDVGLAVPSTSEKRLRNRSDSVPFYEVDHGSLGVMLLRREVYAAIGGLDETMDGGIWCLRDYSRRVEKAGFHTISVPGKKLNYGEPQQFGSLARREERIRKGEQIYRQRWGESHQFCIVLVGVETIGDLHELLSTVLLAARQGNSITILADKSVAKALASQSHPLHHAGISVETLPAFFTDRALKKRLEKLAGKYPDMITVNGAVGVDDNLSGCSLRTFVGMIEDCCQRYYGGRGAAHAGGC